MPADTPAPRGALAVNLLLSAAVTAVLLVLLEGGSRWLERRAPTAPKAEYLWDWERMWDGDFYTVGSAAVGWPPWEEFNADGLRDRAHTREKPPRSWRLVFLGDSVTLGDGIAADEAYPQVLQQRLGLAGRRVEVFNVALWGWSTRQQRLAYTRLVRPYAPDQVVVAVCLNDVPELHNNLARPPAWLRWAHGRSALVRRVVDPAGRELRSVEELFEQPEPPRVRRAFERFAAELALLAAEVRADRAQLALMVFPFRFQLEAGAPAAHAQARLRGLAQAQGLAFFDLLEVLRPLGREAFRDYDHLSAAGAARVASWAEAQLVPAGFERSARLGSLAGAREGDLVAAWSRALASIDAEDREAAAWALGRRPAMAAAARPALSKLLAADGDPGVRAAAAGALAGAARAPGAVAVTSELCAALDDRSEVVRAAAAQALAAQPPAVETELACLVAASRSRDAYVRGFAVWRLGELGPAAAPAVGAVTQALAEEDRVRGVAAQALAKLGPAAAPALPELCAALTKDDARRRWNAAIALGRLGPTAGAAAIPALQAALADPDARVRNEAVRALGRLRASAPATLAALTSRLSDDDERVRATAARALGWIGAPARGSAAQLSRARHDPDARVQREAGKALRRILEADSPKTGTPIGDSD